MSGRHRSRARVVVFGALALVAAACDGPGVVSPTRRTVAISGPGTSLPSIVGTWQRNLYFIDDFGIARSSETSWQFTSGGATTRVLVSRNITFGLVDVQVSAGRYRLEGARVVIDIVTPSPVQFVYDVRRVGNQLELAGQTYLLAGS